MVWRAKVLPAMVERDGEHSDLRLLPAVDSSVPLASPKFSMRRIGALVSIILGEYIFSHLFLGGRIVSPLVFWKTLTRSRGTSRLFGLEVGQLITDQD